MRIQSRIRQKKPPGRLNHDIRGVEAGIEKSSGLGEQASLQEIKTRHRELAKRYHPDAGHQGDGEAIRQLNESYKLLLEYNPPLSPSALTRTPFTNNARKSGIRRQFEEESGLGRDRS